MYIRFLVPHRVASELLEHTPQPLQNNYIFPFTEQTLESSLPQLLDVMFGTIFPFLSALGLLKNYSRIPSSVTIDQNTK